MRQDRTVITLGEPERLSATIIRRSVSINGRSGWGYRLECEWCGAINQANVGSSVSWEDAPGMFAREHAACRQGDVFGVSIHGRYHGHELSTAQRARLAADAKAFERFHRAYPHRSGDKGMRHGPFGWNYGRGTV